MTTEPDTSQSPATESAEQDFGAWLKQIHSIASSLPSASQYVSDLAQLTALQHEALEGLPCWSVEEGTFFNGCGGDSECRRCRPIQAADEFRERYDS